MGEAKVILSEVDNSNYISSDGQVYAAICLYTPKGDATKPTLVTNINQLYSRYIGSDKFTLGCDTGLYSARKFLEMGSNLWVTRVCTSNDSMGAVSVSFDSTNVKTATELVSDSTVLHSAEDVADAIADTTKGIAVYSVNPGAWGKNLVIDIVKSMEPTKGHTLSEAGEVSVNNTTWASSVYEWSTTTNKPVDATAVPVTITAFVGNKSTLCTITQGTVSYEAAVSDCFLKKDGSVYKLYLDKECTALVKASKSGTTVNIEARTGDYTSLDNGDAYIVTVKDSKGNILERAAVSNNRAARDGFGSSIFAETVFGGSTNIGIHVPSSAPAKLPHTIRGIVLSNAKGGDTLSAQSATTLVGDRIKAIKVFRDKDTYPVKVLLDGGCTSVEYKKALLDIAAERKDCVAVLSTLPEDEKSADPLSAILNFRNNVLVANSSYGALFTPHVKIYDEDTASYVMTPPDAYYAGLLSRTAETSEVWFPVAGLNRGVIDSALDVQVRFTDAERDLLVDNQINPIRFYSGQGITIWGNETLRTVASATQSLHVRMLLSTIEPAMAKALEGLLFEMNDDLTRDTARMMLDSFLDDIVARRGIDAKTVVCDTKTNNMPVDLDNNRMIVDVYITPTGYVKTIKLNVTVQSHSISISDEG